MGLVGAAVLRPLAARAEGAAKVPTIGLLLPNSEEEEKRQGFEDAFLQKLGALGWVAGKTVRVETRFGADRGDDAPALARALVATPVDVIVAAGKGVYAAAQATDTIPVVAGTASDLVALGYAGSLAHPGRNVTGTVILAPEVAAKRFEVLREVVPGLRRAGLLLLDGYATNPQVLDAVAAAAKAAAVPLLPYTASDRSSYETAFAAAREVGAGGIVLSDPGRFYGDAAVIASIAIAHRMPTIGPGRTARDGLLVSYGVDVKALFRRAATFVDAILRGARPADIPIERASRFQTIVNLKSARALGIDVPSDVLAAADEVIE